MMISCQKNIKPLGLRFKTDKILTELKALSVYDTRYKKTRTYGNKVYTNMPKDGGECESFTTISANIFYK